MSVFKLPKELCDKLTSAMTEFWWSSGNNRRKISWVAWQRLCRRKDEGGLGFHDICSFNQSLLAKQAWRILQNPQSLVARVLQSKYWKNGSFMECGTGSRPSFAWRSILHGRELIKKGMVMKIGDGKLTKVWTANWIIDPLPRPPMYLPDAEIDLAMTVDELLIPNTGLWDVQKVRGRFVEKDAISILKLKSVQYRQDSWLWGFTKDGAYTARSGYRLLDSIRDAQTPESSRPPPIERKLWSNIWKLKTLPKIKHFVWRALAGALAVSDQLRSRGIQVDPLCKVCGSSRETICHVLFSCPLAQEVWRKAKLPLPRGGLSCNSVFLNVHHLIECTKKKECPLLLKRSLPWILWHLWKARNMLIFEKVQISPETIIKKAEEDSSIWFEVNYTEENTVPLRCENNSDMESWKAPPPGSLKCNIGASWVNESINCGASWILRDHEGKVLLHSRRSYSSVQSHEDAELLATYWAVDCLKTMRFERIIFESSFRQARARLQGYQNGTRAPSLIVRDIIMKLQQMQAWSLDYVVPSRNFSALKIAESVTTDHRYRSYISRDGPSWLRPQLESEAAGSSP